VKKTNSTSFNKVFASGYLAAYALAQLLASPPQYPDIDASIKRGEKVRTCLSTKSYGENLGILRSELHQNPSMKESSYKSVLYLYEKSYYNFVGERK